MLFRRFYQHWIAVVFNGVEADLALTGGVHTATGVVKAMMAGAKVTIHDLRAVGGAASATSK